MEIDVRKGDIADQPDLDAVVNAANTELWMGSGVAGALKRRGGESVERDAVAQGPIALGDAVITGAGTLPNRWVIHAAAMGYRAEDQAVPKRAGTGSSEAIIASCVRRALELADANGARSVGFPALATGVAGFPLDECARAMVGAARAYYGAEGAEAGRSGTAKRGTTTYRGTVERVVFVVRGDDAYRSFAKALGSG